MLHGEVSAGWTPDAAVALIVFDGYGANEQDLAPLRPMLAPALPWAALRGVAPAAIRGSRPSRLAPDATVAAVGFSQGGLMATQLLRTRPGRVAATAVLSGFVQAAPQPADQEIAEVRAFLSEETRAA